MEVSSLLTFGGHDPTEVRDCGFTGSDIPGPKQYVGLTGSVLSSASVELVVLVSGSGQGSKDVGLETAEGRQF